MVAAVVVLPVARAGRWACMLLLSGAGRRAWPHLLLHLDLTREPLRTRPDYVGLDLLPLPEVPRTRSVLPAGRGVHAEGEGTSMLQGDANLVARDRGDPALHIPHPRRCWHRGRPPDALLPPRLGRLWRGRAGQALGLHLPGHQLAVDLLGPHLHPLAGHEIGQGYPRILPLDDGVLGDLHPHLPSFGAHRYGGWGA